MIHHSVHTGVYGEGFQWAGYAPLEFTDNRPLCSSHHRTSSTERSAAMPVHISKFEALTTIEISTRTGTVWYNRTIATLTEANYSFEQEVPPSAQRTGEG